MWQTSRRSCASLDELRSQKDRLQLDRRASSGCLSQAHHPLRFSGQGDAAPGIDFDIMVVEEKPVDRFAEMVRLNRPIRSRYRRRPPGCRRREVSVLAGDSRQRLLRSVPRDEYPSIVSRRLKDFGISSRVRDVLLGGPPIDCRLCPDQARPNSWMQVGIA
jgi:hypothetical protein